MRFQLLVAAPLWAVSLLNATAQDRDVTVYRTGNGVSVPSVVTEVKATYTPEARAARIQGTVIVEVVVRTDGTVRDDLKVLRALDPKFGLDKQAIKACKQWKFTPAMKDGKPVAVRVWIQQTFTLDSK
jgi:TonB family protein